MFRTIRYLLISAFCLAMAQASFAQCGDVIYRVTQGDETRSYSGNEALVLDAGQPGNIRIYYRSNGQTPHTLAAKWGNPGEFGYRRIDPITVRRVIKMDPQKQGGLQRGNVRFTAGTPGQTQIGYQITGANKSDVFNKVPKQCRTGIVTVVVQNLDRDGRPPAPGHDDHGSDDFAIGGRYETDFGVMVLNQNGDRISGTVEHKNGRLSGDLRGNVLRGFWAQEPSYLKPDDAGDFEFTFAADGRSFQDVWRYGTDGPWKNWNGKRLR